MFPIIIDLHLANNLLMKLLHSSLTQIKCLSKALYNFFAILPLVNSDFLDVLSIKFYFQNADRLTLTTWLVGDRSIRRVYWPERIIYHVVFFFFVFSFHGSWWYECRFNWWEIIFWVAGYYCLCGRNIVLFVSFTIAEIGITMFGMVVKWLVFYLIVLLFLMEFHWV